MAETKQREPAAPIGDTAAALPPAPEKPVKAKKPATDDFFGGSDDGGSIGDYIKHLQTPKEEIGTPPVMAKDAAPPAGAEPEPVSPEDQEVLNYFDYTDDHLHTAEFLLIWLDKGFAFGASMVSGLEMNRYRRRVEKPKDDYEAQVTAALVKKYQMALPLEWMLVTALLMAYVPEYVKAFNDRKQVKAARQQQQQSRPIS